MLPLVLIASLAHAQRVALVVGANAAPPGRTRLRYAHADADEVADALVEVGGFSREHVVVLHDPSPEALLAAVRDLPRADLAVFYYSGHGYDGVLFPGGRALAATDVQAAFAEVDAGYRLGILDACAGGTWTGAKGLRPVEAFEVTRPQHEGVAWVAGSSGAQDAHEIALLGGSLFTHHWIAGMRGAADADSDGQVTLDEVFDYARRATLRDSVTLAGEAQSPSFHFDVVGREALVLADLRGTMSTMSLSWGRGEVSVHALDRGTHVADLSARPEGYQLALPPGHYLVRRRHDGVIDVAEVEVRAGQPASVQDADFTVVDAPGRLAAKGDTVPGALWMAPQRGQWTTQLAWGVDHAPSADGTVRRTLAMGGGNFEVGLTDRVSLSFPFPGLSVRIGRPGALEAALRVGGWQGGLGYSNVEGFVVAGEAGIGLDVRWPASDGVDLNVSARAYTPLRSSSAYRSWFPGPWYQAALGTSLHLGPLATLNPGVGLSSESWRSLDVSRTSVDIGSPLRRGSRELPLVQIHVTRGTTLDLHAALSWQIGGGMYERYLLGATFAWPKRRL